MYYNSGYNSLQHFYNTYIIIINNNNNIKNSNIIKSINLKHNWLIIILCPNYPLYKMHLNQFVCIYNAL